MRANRYVYLFVALIVVVASCQDDKDAASVNVVLDQNLVSLVIGTSETLNATVTPNNAAKLTWISEIFVSSGKINIHIIKT